LLHNQIQQIELLFSFNGEHNYSCSLDIQDMYQEAASNFNLDCFTYLIYIGCIY
jgi:hypothetical protein